MKNQKDSMKKIESCPILYWTYGFVSGFVYRKQWCELITKGKIMIDTKYPEITVKLVGKDGNVFNLISMLPSSNENSRIR